jgi:hypothetical protein
MPAGLPTWPDTRDARARLARITEAEQADAHALAVARLNLAGTALPTAQRPAPLTSAAGQGGLSAAAAQLSTALGGELPLAELLFELPGGRRGRWGRQQEVAARCCRRAP